MEVVKDFMVKSFVSVDPETTVQAACELMLEKNASSILIKSGIEYVGVFTGTDLVKKVIALKFQPDEFTVGAAMSSPVFTIDGEKSMISAFLAMQRKNTRHIAVTEKKRIVGIVSFKDVAKYYVEKFAPKKKA
tara:strand:- start:609 stop:1007 length:399 start_codon:yes stop_codon:yes gene_type:complete